jgi:hypothetical protein
MKQSSKRLTSMLLALVLLVAAFIGFFDFVQPTYGDVQDLRGKAVADQGLLKSLGDIVKQAQALISSYNDQSSGTAAIGLALPAGPDMAGALTQIGGIAQADSLSIMSIAVSTPALQVSKSAGTNASSTQAAQPAGNFSLKITATGNYGGFKNFLADLETNLRLFDVQNVSLQPVAGAGAGGKGKSVSVDYFTYNIVVQTYYQAP